MAFYNDKMIELASGGILLDIGANIGMYFESMSKVASKVYAFEPHPDNVEVLKSEALKYNNIEVVSAAIGSKDGITNLFVCDRNHRQHTLLVNIAADPRWGHSLSNFINVPSIKLDTFCIQNNIKGITGIKIDVEGAEEFVIAGALETLRNNNAIISLETHAPINADNVTELLKSCDYIFWNTDKVLTDRIEQDKHYFCVKQGSNLSPFIGEP